MNEKFLARLCTAGLILVIVAIWMLQHPYMGIIGNDSSLYSFLALARLHPSLSQDVFIRFGSQDSFTLFSPAFAAAIKLFDLEYSASVLSFVSELVFFGCAWLLARNLMPARLALLAMGLLVALPPQYGAGYIFSYIESYLTPRQLTEALVLAALAASVKQRHAITAACLLGGLLLHPIMDLAGVVMVACMYVAIPRPRLTIGLVGALASLLIVVTLVSHNGVFAPFDTEWWRLSRQSSGFLFLLNWSSSDWARVIVALTVLGLGALTSDGIVRRLCLAGLLTAAAGVAVSLVYCDLLHSILFTRVQAWRWLWLVQALAVLLLPVIARDCWKSRQLGQAAIVLLATTWVLHDDIASVYTGLACIACAAVKVRQPRLGRQILAGCLLILALALGWKLVAKLEYIELNPGNAARIPVLNLQRTYVWYADGIICSGALLAAWWLFERRERRLGGALLCVTGATACLLLAPLAWQAWTAFYYTPGLRAQFAPWRAVIPEGAQVSWPITPLGTWYFLERPSYYSGHQVAGDIFSREKSIELERRSRWLSDVLAAIGPTQHAGKITANPAPQKERGGDPPNTMNLGVRGLVMACRDPQLDFFVSWTDLGSHAAVDIVPNPSEPRKQLHLYRCADLRRDAGT